MLSLATFGAGFVTRPIGAIVIGAYSDRVGRKPALMLCFMLIGFSIVGMALIPTYATIGIAAPILAVLARMLQGFSLGGEIGSTTAFLLEAAPVNKRGLIVGWQDASQLIALVAGGDGRALCLPSFFRPLCSMLLPMENCLLADSAPWQLPFWSLAPHKSAGNPALCPSRLPRRLRRNDPGLVRLASHWRVMTLGLIVLSAPAQSPIICRPTL